MNNLENLITDYAILENTMPPELAMFFLILVVGFMAIILFLLSPKLIALSICCLIFVFIAPFKVKGTNTQTLDNKATILKKDYNIDVNEKNNIIELTFDKKIKSSNLFKNNFKVSFEKINTENYYVYFDRNKYNKKEINSNEIKEMFENIKTENNKKFNLS